jgi:hypothetical protein
MRIKIKSNKDKLNRKEIEYITCIDCKNLVGYMFMVKDRLWIRFTKKNERNRILCYRCFCKRMGRDFKLYDFKQNVPISRKFIRVLKKCNYFDEV